MAEVEASKSSVGALLNGIAQQIFYRNSEVTEDLLKSQLYPDATQQQFKALYEKMKALLKSMATADMDHAQLEAFLTAQTLKQGAGGITPEEAAALARFWKSQRGRVRESLLMQSCWEPTLKGLSWRVDLQTAVAHGGPPPTVPVALLELELGSGQVSDFLCVEMDDHNVQHVLNKMADIQAAIETIVQRT
ncbi:COMM domain-containing protein 1 [Corythoichthys intestinalis]|uniref:COMM domain-containing protein 1 n=1 Tax=Corythoichthys intestinalis TaxID=161448 RepID=UPI0025A4E50B|nr:COMM domain-containing protein 1 [Corythoichthys intestinalis]XP_061791388.1 COMM domain-containing protein 1-like [Nerophis lumbriciformis]